jgi:glycosyltransferase involved in cell wall biosynthesis
MSRRRKKPKPAPKKKPASPLNPAANARWLKDRYVHACTLAERRNYDEAQRAFVYLGTLTSDGVFKASLRNDLAVLAAAHGDLVAARAGFVAALALDPLCANAKANLALLDEDHPPSGELHAAQGRDPAAMVHPRIKVALVSFLFNWPSTGGGNIHTVELGHFLMRAGYVVQHFFARYEPWGIGRIERGRPLPGHVLDFDAAGWNADAIQARFADAVRAFDPDCVIITDSWNFKPLLAEAVRPFPYFLRMQALECLCPLNNIRLLPEADGTFRQCPLHQLANPAECGRCVQERGHRSGALHQLERALSGAGTPAYHERLLRAVRDAEAVLVVNPLSEVMVSPYARRVCVVTAGMDPARFPWPWAEGPVKNPSPQPPPRSGEGEPDPSPQPPPRSGEGEPDSNSPPPGSAVGDRGGVLPPPLRFGEGVGGRGGTTTRPGVHTLFFAGLVDEWIKGFAVLREACRLLWQRRQDFELVATGEPAGRINEYTRYVGWLSQEELPRHLRAADVCVVPATAQEALGRTAVEAMAVGRPVVASRLGGLPFTVPDGAAGLLFEPGDADDLARKIEMLLDDAGLREQLGLAGRRRFEEHYAWPGLIERHYKPLLKKRAWPAMPRAGQPQGMALYPEAVLDRPRSAFTPFIPARVDQEKLIADVGDFFGLKKADAAAMYSTYRALHDARGYAETLGELKTLCFEEAFVLFAALNTLRPRTVVEIGAQDGKALRRLVDIKNLLGLDCRVIAFDVADQRRHVGPGEAELVLKDLTGCFVREVLQAYEPGLVFHDEHSYALLREVITETLAHGRWTLAVHDCGRGLCNPHMTLRKEDRGVTSHTGVWERHVLAEVFGVELPTAPRLDDMATGTHRLRIFETPHGLGVLRPRAGQAVAV